MPVKLPKAIFDNLCHLSDPFQRKFMTKITSASYPQEVTGVIKDLELSWKFLWSYNGSLATYNSYRREIERLLQWSWYVKSVSVCALRREDLESFLNFCKNPPRHWIGHQQAPRFIWHQGHRVPNIHWRPFVQQVSKRCLGTAEHQFQLSQATIRAIFSILSSFYNYLVQEEASSHNPVMTIRQKSKYLKQNVSKAPVRRLTNFQWDYVIETVENLANTDPKIYERSLFIVNALYALYLRISELVADERSVPVMGDFKQDQDQNWWFHVTGKGNKDRMIAVSDSMLYALKRYRKHLRLSPLPYLEEIFPLVSKIKGRGSITSTRMVRYLVQECFDHAYARMVKQGLADEAQALRVATVHWLRHTSISEDVKVRPREHIRDDAGHSSMQTTDRYIDSDMRERHQSGRYKKIREF